MLSIYCKLISVGEFSEVSKYNPQLMGKVQHHVMSSEVTKCQFGISLHWSDTHVGHVCLTVMLYNAGKQREHFQNESALRNLINETKS